MANIIAASGFCNSTCQGVDLLFHPSRRLLSGARCFDVSPSTAATTGVFFEQKWAKCLQATGTPLARLPALAEGGTDQTDGCSFRPACWKGETQRLNPPGGTQSWNIYRCSRSETRQSNERLVWGVLFFLRDTSSAENVLERLLVFLSQARGQCI